MLSNRHTETNLNIGPTRPRAKLFEELLIDGEVTGTLHPRIWQMKEGALDVRALEGELAKLESTGHDPAAQVAIRGFLMKWVAGYGESDQCVAPAPLRAVTSGGG